MLRIGWPSSAHFSHVGDVKELGIPLLGIPHGKIFEKLPVTEPENLKYLADMVFGYVAPGAGHSQLYLRNGQRHPKHVLVLRKAGDVRFNHQPERLDPFRMLRQLGLASASRTADTSLPRGVVVPEFFDATSDSVFAMSHFFTYFADAMPSDAGCTFRKVVPLLAFVELRHKRRTRRRKAFWRSILTHFISIASTYKVKNNSPDFLLHTINNQQFISIFYHFSDLFSEPLQSHQKGFNGPQDTGLWQSENLPGYFFIITKAIFKSVLFAHNKTPKVFCLTFGVHIISPLGLEGLLFF